ncbi:MAG: hypothetical protein QGH25_16010 [Candidatus Latescibacteria bacterium]|nr:hypothetical protein [Candidatus Latescibacterota bacterium]
MADASGPQLRIHSRHPRHFPLCFHQGSLYSACSNALYRWDDLRQPVRVASLPIPWSRRLPARIRLLERLLRLGFSHLAIAESGARLAIANRVLYFAATTDAPFQPLGSLPAPARRPMRFGVETAGEDRFYIAEYFSNPLRGPVRIWTKQGNAPIEPAYTFPHGSIRHIHLAQKDPFTEQLWIATGDYGPECRIAWTDDGFNSLHAIGGGDQSWRATHLVFTRDAVLWGMDSPWERASIVRWDRASGQREFIASAPAPVLHGAFNEAGWTALSTSVEPNYLGETSTTLWAVHDEGAFAQVAAYAKDRWSPHYFQFGLLYFPTGIAPGNHLVFSGNAVDGLDDEMVIGELCE